MNAVLRLVAFFRNAIHEPMFPRRGRASRLEVIITYAIRAFIQLGREASRDRLPRKAASLAFQTLFATLPILVFAATVLTLFISRQEVDGMTEWLAQHMIPQRARTVSTVIQDMATQVEVEALGVVGGLGLMGVGVMLFMSISQVVNDIWGVIKKPRLAYQVAAAFVVLLLLPALTALSIYITQRYVRLPWYGDVLAPLPVTVIALWFAYRFIPFRRVSSRAALASSLCVGVLLEAGKMGFGAYVARVDITIRGLYGAIGFIPFFLLWLYLSWLIFLFGVELTYTIQNLRSLWMGDRGRGRTAYAETAGSLAVRAAHEVYRQGRLAPAELACRLEVPAAVIVQMAERLEEAGILQRDGDTVLEPARPAGEVTVTELLRLFPDSLSEENGQLCTSELNDMLSRLQDAQEAEAGDVSLQDLL